MKRTFLVFCLQVCSCFVFPAAAQEAVYPVTETELTELENILQTLQTSKQKQQLQVLLLQEQLNTAHKRAQHLQATLTKAEAQAQHLKRQLQTEKEALTALQKSYTAYEQESAEALQVKQTEIDELKEKVYRRTLALVILSAILTVGVLFTGMKWYLKGKLRLFPP